MVFENQDVYSDLNAFRSDLTIEAGFYKEHVTFDGSSHYSSKYIIRKDG